MIRYTPPEGYFENLSERVKKRHKRRQLRKAMMSTFVVLTLILSLPPLLDLIFSKPESQQQAFEEYILDEVETELVIETLAFNQ